MTRRGDDHSSSGRMPRTVRRGCSRSQGGYRARASVHMSQMVTILEWDSEFFRVPIGRAEIDGDTLAAAVDEARGRGVKCLYLVIPSAHPPSLEDAMRR